MIFKGARRTRPQGRFGSSASFPYRRSISGNCCRSSQLQTPSRLFTDKTIFGGRISSQRLT